MNILSHITIAGAFAQAMDIAHHNQIAQDRRTAETPAKRLSLRLPFAGLWLRRIA